jgi:hypothetical protein
MKVLKARFDGKVLIPEEPIDLPLNCSLEVCVSAVSDTNDKPLLELLRQLDSIPSNSAWPQDGAAQHDHYLYGADKR